MEKVPWIIFPSEYLLIFLWCKASIHIISVLICVSKYPVYLSWIPVSVFNINLRLKMSLFNMKMSFEVLYKNYFVICLSILKEYGIFCDTGYTLLKKVSSHDFQNLCTRFVTYVQQDGSFLYTSRTFASGFLCFVPAAFFHSDFVPGLSCRKFVPVTSCWWKAAIFSTVSPFLSYSLEVFICFTNEF